MTPTRSKKIASLMISVALTGFAGAAFAAANDSESYARLGGGSMGKFFWESRLETAPKTGGICVAINTSEPSSPYTVTTDETLDCGGAGPDGSMVETISNGKAGRKERTVAVFVLPSSAHRLTVNLGNRGVATTKVRHLNDAKATELHISPIAYWARGFAGPFCLGRFIVYDAHGQKLSDSGRAPCR